MDYEFLHSDDFLIIKLLGTAGPNDRLALKQYLAPYLRLPYQRIIVDLQDINETRNFYIIMGVLHTMKKEFQLLGAELKLCAPQPAFYRCFEANRFDQIFDIGPSIEQAKLRFEVQSNDG